MNTRKRTRRATTIDIADSIPTKQGKTKKTTRNSFSDNTLDMNNSSPEAEMPIISEIENNNETPNSQNSNAVKDEDSTQPLFPDTDPSDILAQADVLLAQMDAYTLETSSLQNNSMQQHSSDTEQKPSTSMANTNESTSAASNEQSPNSRSANNSMQSTSTANQSQFDDSVILIDDGVMPRPSRADEDVIFVEAYVKQPPRVTGIVDLCDEDEDESLKKNKLMPALVPTSSAKAAQAAQFLTSPVASTSKLSGIVVKCPVCLDSIPNEEVMSTTCGHLFCDPCIRSTIKARKKCPMCNRSLTLSKIHRIYFQN